jgi:hypothetical protein
MESSCQEVDNFKEILNVFGLLIWGKGTEDKLMLESFEEGICSVTSIKMNRLLNDDHLGSPRAISIVAVLISLSCTHSAFQQQMPRCFCSSLLLLPLPWDVQ